jgi:hypothetical protein
MSQVYRYQRLTMSTPLTAAELSKLRELQADEKAKRALAGDCEDTPQYWDWCEAESKLQDALYRHRETLIAAAEQQATPGPLAEKIRALKKSVTQADLRRSMKEPEMA